jgi:tetratricopeptide (TPR) repeat protein
MIVKNESRVITRLLRSVIGQIDAIVISDTGSTDNTKLVITNFVESYPNVQLVFLPDTPFKDFGYNRTYSLKGCVDWVSKATAAADTAYILLLDADMIFKQTGKHTLKQYLAKNDTPGLFNITQGSPQYYYYNSRIIKNTIWPNSRYLGVTHEYLDVPAGGTSQNVPITDFFIEDIGDGGAKSDKFERDISLLSQGLTDEPTNARYMFYLANSMRDANRVADAIEMYKRRIDAGGWFEEVWYSHYEIGNCYLKLAQPENAILWWLKGLDFNDYRIENLYQIVHYYCRACFYKLAHHFYFMAKTIMDSRQQDDSILFFDKGMHTFLLDFEYTIFAHYYNPLKGNVIGKFTQLLADPLLTPSIKHGLYYNLKFESPKLNSILQSRSEEKTALMNSIENVASAIIDDVVVVDGYKNSTPTIIYDSKSKKVYINIRYVNYEIDGGGNYVKRPYIGTMNAICQYVFGCESPTKHTLLLYDESYDNENDGYVGLEDLRFFLFAPKITHCDPFTGQLVDSDKTVMLLYNCNRGIGNTGKITVECGSIIDGVEGLHTSNPTVFDMDETEKNWAMFAHDGKCKFIYKWGGDTGLMIAEKSCIDMGNKLANWQTRQSPPFFRDLRGSSNGVLMPDGHIWFICHLVSYEERRFYYHCFVVLDAETLDVVRYSNFWTFEGSPVEYCTSFIYDDSGASVIIGYSVMDCSTKFLQISVAQITMDLFSQI